MERLTYFKKLIADHKSNMDDDHESMIYHYLEQIRDKTIINDEQLSSQMSGKVAICINYANRPQIINWNLNRLQRISCCFWCLIYSSLAERRPSRPWGGPLCAWPCTRKLRIASARKSWTISDQTPRPRKPLSVDTCSPSEWMTRSIKLQVHSSGAIAVPGSVPSRSAALLRSHSRHVAHHHRRLQSWGITFIQFIQD